MPKDWKLEDHHIWCNNAWSTHPDECKMCQGLKAKYPIEKNMSEHDLMKKYFPNNVRNK